MMRSNAMSKQKMMKMMIVVISRVFAQLALVGDVRPPNAQMSSIIMPIKGI